MPLAAREYYRNQVKIYISRKVKPFCTGCAIDPVRGAEKSRKKQRSSENRSAILDWWPPCTGEKPAFFTIVPAWLIIQCLILVINYNNNKLTKKYLPFFSCSVRRSRVYLTRKKIPSLRKLNQCLF